MHFSTISATLNTLVAVTSICSTATSHLLDMGAGEKGGEEGEESFWVQYLFQRTFDAGFRIHCSTSWAADTLCMYKTDMERGKKVFIVNILCCLLMNQYAKTIVPFCEIDLKVRALGLVRLVTAGWCFGSKSSAATPGAGKEVLLRGKAPAKQFCCQDFFVCLCWFTVCWKPNMYDYAQSSIRVCTCWEASGQATENTRRVALRRRRHSHIHTAGFIHVIIVVFSRSGISHLRWCSCLHGCVKSQHVFHVLRRERPTPESNIQPFVLLMRRWGNMCNNVSHYRGGGEWTVALQRCQFIHLLVAFLLLTRMSCKSVITRPNRVWLRTDFVLTETYYFVQITIFSVPKQTNTKSYIGKAELC